MSEWIDHIGQQDLKLITHSEFMEDIQNIKGFSKLLQSYIIAKSNSIMDQIALLDLKVKEQILLGNEIQQIRTHPGDISSNLGNNLAWKERLEEIINNSASVHSEFDVAIRGMCNVVRNINTYVNELTKSIGYRHKFHKPTPDTQYYPHNHIVKEIRPTFDNPDEDVKRNIYKANAQILARNQGPSPLNRGDKHELVKEIKRSLYPEIKNLIKSQVRQEIQGNSANQVLDKIYQEESKFENMPVEKVKPVVDNVIKKAIKETAKKISKTAAKGIAVIPPVQQTQAKIQHVLNKVTAGNKIQKDEKKAINVLKTQVKANILKGVGKVLEKVEKNFKVLSIMKGHSPALDKAKAIIKNAVKSVVNKIDDKFIQKTAVKAIEKAAVTNVAKRNSALGVPATKPQLNIKIPQHQNAQIKASQAANIITKIVPNAPLKKTKALLNQVANTVVNNVVNPVIANKIVEKTITKSQAQALNKAAILSGKVPSKAAIDKLANEIVKKIALPVVAKKVMVAVAAKNKEKIAHNIVKQAIKEVAKNPNNQALLAAKNNAIAKENTCRIAAKEAKREVKNAKIEAKQAIIKNAPNKAIAKKIAAAVIKKVALPIIAKKIIRAKNEDHLVNIITKDAIADIAHKHPDKIKQIISTKKPSKEEINKVANQVVKNVALPVVAKKVINEVKKVALPVLAKKVIAVVKAKNEEKIAHHIVKQAIKEVAKQPNNQVLQAAKNNAIANENAARIAVKEGSKEVKESKREIKKENKEAISENIPNKAIRNKIAIAVVKKVAQPIIAKKILAATNEKIATNIVKHVIAKVAQKNPEKLIQAARKEEAQRNQPSKAVINKLANEVVKRVALPIVAKKVVTAIKAKNEAKIANHIVKQAIKEVAKNPNNQALLAAKNNAIAKANAAVEEAKKDVKEAKKEAKTAVAKAKIEAKIANKIVKQATTAVAKQPNNQVLQAAKNNAVANAKAAKVAVKEAKKEVKEAKKAEKAEKKEAKKAAVVVAGVKKNRKRRF